MTGGTLQGAPPAASAPPDDAPTWWVRALRRWWPAGYGAAVGALLFVVAHRAMPDDGLISLSFARNLAEHGQWALTTGIESNTATSPLNVWLLAGLHLATGGRAFVAAGLLLMLCLAATAVWLRHLGGTASAVLGTAMLASCPVLTSAIGLETYLAAAVLVGLVRYGTDGRWVVAGVFAGAAFLTRPDLTLAAVAALLVLAVTHRRLLWGLPLGAAVAAPWVLFSWLHFGSAWANSVPVKWTGNGWNGTTIATVDYWTATFWYPSLIMAATLVLGVLATIVAAWRRWWPACAFGVGGAVHLGALLSTPTPPTEYYLAPAMTGLGLALVLVAARARWALVVPAAVVAGSVALSIAHGALWSEGLAPMRQNWATNAEYAAIARELPVDAPIMSGEIGALAFSCQDRGCTVIDPVLTDPGRVDRFVAKWRFFHPAWELNYAHYEVPPPTPVGYRLVLGLTDHQPGDWPITRAPGVHQWARLAPVADPFIAGPGW